MGYSVHGIIKNGIHRDKTTKKVYIHKEWNSSRYGTVVKPKTIVLLDEDLDVLAFGQEAKRMFSNISSILSIFNRLYICYY